MIFLKRLNIQSTKQELIKDRIKERARDIEAKGFDNNSGFGIIDSAFLNDLKPKTEPNDNHTALYMVIGSIIIYALYQILT